MTSSAKLRARWRRQRGDRFPGFPAWGPAIYWLAHFLRWAAVEGQS